MDRVRFDVGGQTFAINRSLLGSGSCSKLSQLSKLERDVIVIDRPPDMFAAVLAMCQTGELHVPRSCCPGAFLLELDYWGIKTDKLATCCYFKIHRFINQQRDLRQFETSMHLELEAPSKSSGALASLSAIKNKVWSLVDFREKTVFATIYFAISLLMVLVSICSLAFSTDPAFKRNMTNCERYDYMKEVGMEDLDLVEEMLRAGCGNDTRPDNTTSAVTLPPFKQVGDEDDDYVEIEVRVAPTTPPPPSMSPLPPCKPGTPGGPPLGNPRGNITENGIAFTDNNMNNTDNNTNCIMVRGGFGRIGIPIPMLKRIKIPNFKIPVDVFRVLELLTTVYFTADITIRVLTCPSLMRYFMSIVNISDAVALLGVYMNWLLTSIRPKEQYEVNWFDLLEYLQMLRCFRLFRLVMSFNISKVLAYSVGQSLKDGFIMVLLLVTGMCTFSICLFLSEDKYTVKTIPEAWYWSVITMTTVGYGDMSPKSPFGRLVACVCSVSGVLVFALTVPLFVNQFMTLYQYADVTINEDREKEKSRDDRFDLLSRPFRNTTEKQIRKNAIKLRPDTVRVTST